MIDAIRPVALEASAVLLAVAAPGDPGADWRAQAACARTDPEVFFHSDNERGEPRQKRDALAKAVCAGCPVIQECREQALAVREPYGVWGGLTEEEREAIWSAERRREAAA
jgi:WhiB family redox-sensing transcriptional regulator